MSAPVVTNAASSVWKVSKGNQHLYLGGTIHFLPPSQFPLPEEFQTAYRNSESVVLEADVPGPQEVQAQQQMMMEMTFADGRTLDRMLSEETYKALSHYFSGFGADLEAFNSFKPGFIVTLMAVMEAQRARLFGEGVDAYFDQLSQRDNKSQEYLESLGFQVDLIRNLGKGYEDEFIRSNIEQVGQFEAMYTNFLPAWRAGDIKAMEEIFLKPVIESDPVFYESMIVKRNKNWIAHIEKMLTDEDKEFVLVGVGHLLGKDSVITLLQQKGYQVSQL
ncbi:TraB/GumN family protein [Spongorhabdus nitratireducens]